MSILRSWIDKLTGNVNYVYLVESLVIISVVIVLLFVFYQLGLLKKPK